MGKTRAWITRKYLMTKSSPVARIIPEIQLVYLSPARNRNWGNKVFVDKDHIRILLIEDDEDDYSLVRALLSEGKFADFSLEWVQTYEKGLEELRRADYDAYLLDYR